MKLYRERIEDRLGVHLSGYEWLWWMILSSTADESYHELMEKLGVNKTMFMRAINRLERFGIVKHTDVGLQLVGRIEMTGNISFDQFRALNTPKYAGVNVWLDFSEHGICLAKEIKQRTGMSPKTIRTGVQQLSSSGIIQDKRATSRSWFKDLHLKKELTYTDEPLLLKGWYLKTKIQHIQPKIDMRKVYIGQRHIQNMGRFFICEDMRRIMDLDAESKLEFSYYGRNQDAIAIRKASEGCLFCSSLDELKFYKGRIVCVQCIKELKGKANS